VINLWEKGQGLSSEELIVTTPAHGEEDMYLYMEQSGAGSSTPCKAYDKNTLVPKNPALYSARKTKLSLSWKQTKHKHSAGSKHEYAQA
jgi:hypothetical protein